MTLLLSDFFGLKPDAFQVSALLQWHELISFLMVNTIKFFLYFSLKLWKDSLLFVFLLHLCQSFHSIVSSRMQLWALPWRFRDGKSAVIQLYRSYQRSYNLFWRFRRASLQHHGEQVLTTSVRGRTFRTSVRKALEVIAIRRLIWFEKLLNRTNGKYLLL